MGRYCLGVFARGEVANLQPGKQKVTSPGGLKQWCGKIYPGQLRGQRMLPRLRQNLEGLPGCLRGCPKVSHHQTFGLNLISQPSHYAGASEIDFNVKKTCRE